MKNTNVKNTHPLAKGALRALILLPAALGLASTGSAQDILWEIDAEFGALDGGGRALGYFIVEEATPGASLFDRITEWEVDIDGGADPFRYYHGLGTHKSFEDGPALFFLNGNERDQDLRAFFMEILPAALPEGPGTFTLQPDTIGELIIVNGESTARTFPLPVTLTGSNLADAADNDIYAEGGRLAEVAQSGDPVDLISGAFTYSALLLEGKSLEQPVKFEVFYDSDADDIGTGGVGKKWNHSYEWYLVGQESSSDDEEFAGRLAVVRADRAADYFNFQEDAEENVTITPQFPQSRTKLTYDEPSDEVTYTNYAGLQYIFDLEQGFETTIEDEDGVEEEVFVFYLAGVMDRNGRRSNLSYEDLGGGDLRLKSIASPAPGSHTATLTYDAEDCIVSIDYESGLMHVDLTYDSNQNLTSFSSSTDPNLTSRFTYDGQSNLLTGTVGPGAGDDPVFVSTVYGAHNRVVSQFDAMGGTTTFAYETVTGDPNPAAFQRTTVTDPCGNVSTRTFDEQDRTLSAKNSAGDEFTWCYDKDGNLCESTGPLGTRKTEFDANSGDVLCLVNELGQRTDLEWENGVLKSLATNGLKLEYEYDAQGNLTSFMKEDGQKLTFEHDAQGRMVRSTDYLGRVYENTYDSSTGQLTRTKTPTGDVTRTYDDLGRVASVTDQNGNTRNLTYAASGALSSSTAANGERSTIATDAFGRVTKEVNHNDVSVEYERNSKGDITATIDAEGNRFEYTFDEMGRYTSRKDPAGMMTTLEHHPNGEIAKVTDALGGIASATFTEAGQKATVTDPNGGVTSFAHDALGRVLSETDALGRKILNAYDASGNVTSVMTARGQEIQFSYDDAGRLANVSDPDKTLEYTWDAANRRTAVKQNSGTTTVTYHAGSGLIATRTDEFGNSIEYAYDAVGNLTELTYSDGKKVAYTYDSRNRMTSVTDWESRTTEYSYDGLVVRTKLPDGSSTAMEFDVCGRLKAITDTSEAGDTNYSGEWEFDSCGRTVKATESLPLESTLDSSTTELVVDAAHQIESAGGRSFTYDDDGNLISGAVDGVDATFAYDCQNRLLEHNDDKFRYDPDGFRIETVIDGVTSRRIWDVTASTQRLLEEHDSNGRITRRYVHGLGLIAQEDAEDGAVAVYHYDNRGSTVALTNLSGRITDRYAYAPFGDCTDRVGSTPNPFTYNGRDGVMDTGNGMFCMRSRDYIPSLGRFLQKEPAFRGALTDPATLNPYAFGDGNPIDHIDPRGEFGFLTSAIGAGLGIVAGGVGQIISNAVQGKPAFEDVAGSALQGAITGGAVGLARPAGLAMSTAIMAGGVGGAAGNALNQGIAIAEGRQSGFDTFGLIQDTAIGSATFGVAQRLPFVATKAPKQGFKVFSEIALKGAKKIGGQALLGYFEGRGPGGVIEDATFIHDGYVYYTQGHLISAPPDYTQFGYGSADVTSGALGRGEEAGAIKYRGSQSSAWNLNATTGTAGQYLNSSYGGFYGVNLNGTPSQN